MQHFVVGKLPRALLLTTVSGCTNAATELSPETRTARSNPRELSAARQAQIPAVQVPAARLPAPSSRAATLA